MEETIGQMITILTKAMSMIISAFQRFTNALSPDGLKTFSPAVYKFCESAQSATLLIAYVILAFFFAKELYDAAQRASASGGGGRLSVQLIAGIMIKLVLCKLVIDNIPTILNGIFSLAGTLGQKFVEIIGDPEINTLLDKDKIATSIANLNFWSRLLLSMFYALATTCTGIALIVADVIVVARMFELYVYFVFAPIPLATLPSQDMSQIGKNFLKSFTATCIQGAIVLLVLGFFPMIMAAYFQQLPETDSPFLSMLPILGYSIALILAVTASGRWAKSIMNAI